MDTEPEGWTDTEYKKFRVGESDSESESDSDSEDEGDTKGYQAKKYKKILVVEELVPE